MNRYIKMRVEKLSRKRFFQPLPMLEDILPYEDTNGEFVLLRNGKIGCGLQVQWPHHLVTDDRAIGELEGTVARFLLGVDSDVEMQFQLKKELGNFLGHVFFISSPLQMNLSLFPKTISSLSEKQFEEKSKKLRTLSDSFAAAIRSEGARVEKYVFDFKESSGVVQSDCLQLGDKTYYALVPLALPSSLSSQVYRALYFEEGEFLISSGLRVLSKEETEARINQRKFWLQNSLGASAARQRNEVELFEKGFVGGERLVATSLAVVTTSKDDNLRNILSQATQTPWVWERAGASKIILDTLPFNHYSSFMQQIGRSVYLPTTTSVRLLPLLSGGLKKNKKKALQYPSVEGDITGLDLRDTPGCHTAVVAGTRSGKSFLVANILHRYLSGSNPPVVSIIDKRASYETLTKYHDGEVIAFSPERLKALDFPFHPLAGPLNDAHCEFLCSYISLLAELAKPDEPVYAVDKVIILEAIRSAVQSLKITAELTKVSELTLTMSDIVSALGRINSPSARQLTQKLRPYYGSGTYAAYFDREHSGKLLEANILSFDLDGLEGDSLLQSAVSQAILGQIMSRMRKASKEGRWGILLVEEIGVLGSSIKGLAEFVADAWKTMAKLGVVCIGVTNDVEDYLHKSAAKAIWNNSPNKIYLRMTHDQIRGLTRENVVGGQLAELLPRLKTIPGEKADFILSAEERIYPLQFKPDPTSYWLGTSKHEDILQLNQLTKTLTLKQAISQLAGAV